MARLILTSLAAVLWLAGVAEAQTLERIKESGTFKLGYREDAAPFAFKNELGEPAGYSVDLCRVIAAAAKERTGLANIKIDYVPVGTEDRFKAIEDGRIDILCGATTVTLSRRELVDFSLFTFVDGASVLLRTDGPETFDGLADQKIGVRGATTTEQALRNTLDELKMEAEIVPVASHDEGLKKLLGGDIAAYFGDQAILVFLVAKSSAPDQLKIAEQQFTYEPYALALPRGDDDFRLLIDRTLSRLYLSGKIEQVFANAFGPNAKPSGLLKAVYIIDALTE